MSGTYAPSTTGSGSTPGRPGITDRATFGSTSAMASIDGEDPAPDRRPAPGRQALDRVDQGLLVGRRRLDHRGEPAERHEPDLGPRRLARHELDRGLLGRLDARRVDVGRAHAPRHVHREDDRRRVGGHAEHDHGPPERDHQRRDARPRTARTAGGAAAATRRASPPGSATGSSSARPVGAAAGSTGRPRSAPGRRARAPAARSTGTSRQPPSPGEREHAAGDEQREAEGREERRDLERLAADDEPRLQIAVDRRRSRPGRRRRGTSRR